MTHTVVVDVMSDKRFGIENQTIRLFTAIGAGALMLGSVITAVQSWTNLQRDIEYLTKNVEHLNSKIVGKSPEGWHKTEMRAWCDRTELVNREINWRCPAISDEWP